MMQDPPVSIRLRRPSTQRPSSRADLLSTASRAQNNASLLPVRMPSASAHTGPLPSRATVIRATAAPPHHRCLSARSAPATSSDPSEMPASGMSHPPRGA
ncbi:hypothetical protein OBBRIDRAFT_792060 [Obba rivulosa]|uniref:Uncharacterized protein n=1 Tax=Obba rivulosa TaxID=1052685 RepID=A0A8E2AVG7_9APHY|nr:hypothetical protein OBBRIDRAFT_792060 [Obba rivulosa]